MIYGIGTDIVEIARVKEIYEKHREHFVRNILTDPEIELLDRKKNKAEFLAGRWAAKEAFSKALGTGIREGCSFADIEILPDEFGKPQIGHISPETAGSLKARGITKVHVSISHEQNFAVATVLMEA